jgi:NAD(P)-dependent dehydrogenase (short-subunit alcohol dehydrogenase family)
MNKNYININDMVSQYETDIGIKGALGTLATGRDSMLAIGQIDILVNNAAIILPHRPGGADTEGYREAFNNRGREDNPKLMQPEEIAQLGVFLASGHSTAITGTAIDAFGATNPLFE